MHLLPKVLAALLAAALAATGVLWHLYRAQGARLAAAQTQVQMLDNTLAATRRSLNVYMERTRATAARLAQRQKELTHALENHQDWRDAPVPDAVFDSLYPDHRAAGAAARPAADPLP